MDENLLGYLLNSLDEATHAQVEAYLKERPQAQAQLEKLRRALAPLEDDRDGIETPPDLPVRTLALVAEHCCRELPRSPRPNVQPFTGSRPLWRRPDVLVAASILFVAVTLLFPGIAYHRHHQARLECANNLREFGRALLDYKTLHSDLPRFDHQAPGKVVGLVMNQIQDLSPQDFQQQAPQLVPCYAYSLGYLDNAGQYHSPTVPQGEGLSEGAVPLMADRPPTQVQLGGNSPHHGGFGQNVLFHNGSVMFLSGRKISYGGAGFDDDIYLNGANKVAAGLNPYDIVLASSETPP